jgi:hypothetical protein
MTIHTLGGDWQFNRIAESSPAFSEGGGTSPGLNSTDCGTASNGAPRPSVEGDEHSA